MGKKQGNTILILLIGMGIVLAGVGFFVWQRQKPLTLAESASIQTTKNLTPNPRSETSTIKVTKSETEGWMKYQNESLGFEFDYPASFGESLTEHDDPTVRKPMGNETGELVKIVFPKGETSFGIITYTDDYKSYLWQPSEYKCLKEFSDSYDGHFGSQCRNIKIGNQIPAVFLNNFGIPECSPYFSTSIYIKNPGHKFSNIRLDVTLDESLKLTFNCVDQEEAEKDFERAKQFSQRIMSESNLSQKDLAKLLLFKQIADTFKLLDL